ncbi:MAG TPA: LacI family DNA-binding transcriptional regulator, partial [Gaiellaceae bacterium]
MTTRPTIRDVAQRAGVSIATVSRVLNEKGDVRSTTRERVHEAALELGYSPDSVGRALASQRTRLVGVLVGDNAGHRDLSLMFFGKVLAAISRRLGQQGYEPLLLQDANAGGAHRFDAAILIGVDEDDPVVLDMSAHEIPLVGVDVHCGAAFVGSDHTGGVRLALAHLRSLGHRRIAHIAGATNTLAGGERLAAFRQACADAPDEYVRFGDFSSASGYREACALLALDEPPTAIVAASDLMALAALQAIWESGRRPGRDVAVVGFDDLEAAALAHPPLTTIRQDFDELGRRALRALVELIDADQ